MLGPVAALPMPEDGSRLAARLLSERLLGCAARSAARPAVLADALAERAGTVLIAEDSETAMAVLSTQVAGAGYEVLEARDGDAAVELALRHRPDVILLDIEMPGLTGYEVIGRLKGEPQTRDTPIIFISQRATVDDLVQGLDLGAHDYLGKPYRPAELAARVRAALRVKRLQDGMSELTRVLERQALVDPLTGLPNRRFMETELSRAVARWARYRRPVAVLLVDVDHFKHVNDCHGHAFGDEAMRSIAGRLAGRLRRDDAIGRWGGDEFLAVLGETEAPEAAALAEALRREVAAAPVQHDGVIAGVTISVGWAEVVTTDPAEVLRRADADLLAFKRAR